MAPEQKSTVWSMRLWQLVSPALPVGAYSWSDGLEPAVTAEWIGNETDAGEWILGLLSNSLAVLDVPVLSRLYGAYAQSDCAAIVEWNLLLQAARESSELLDSDRHLGAALRRLLDNLEVPDSVAWNAAGAPGFASQFARACAHWQVPCEACLHGYLWTWAENQVAAAVKLVPLGQTAGQRILIRVADRIPAAVARGLALADDEIGALTPGLAILSAHHEEQYTRLFRS